MPRGRVVNADAKADMQDVLYGCLMHDRYDTSEQALEELMPIVHRYAAAVLDRLAAEWERRSDNVPLGRGSHESGAVNRVGDLRECAGLLRARAAELRGES
jgi:hypothetical protein